MEYDKNSVLIVDDEKLNLSALTHILSKIYTVYVAKDGKMAIEAAQKLRPDCILLDIIMPELSGFEVIAELKQIEETKDIPVIFVTGLTQTKEEEKGLVMGAADYIHKPFSPSIVRLRVANQIQIVNQTRAIQRLSITDPLTNIFNRRQFNNCLNQEWQRSLRDGNYISLVMADIDDFKKINDTYGHHIGDLVLRNVADNMKNCLRRPMDVLARWGGEEFIALLPTTTLDGGILVAESMRITVMKKEIPSEEIEGISTTLSLGVNCVMPQKDLTMSDFIIGADKALYQAKNLGKNRVCLANI